MSGSRKSGTNPRALGTNPRALRGWKPKRKGGRWKKLTTPKAGIIPTDRNLPRWLRFEVMKRDGFRCTYCGCGPPDGVSLQVDHVLPVSAGGTNVPANLTTSCQPCNRGKGRFLLTESLI